MSSLVLDRINSQIRQDRRVNFPSVQPQKTERKNLSNPINSDILRKILMETNEPLPVATLLDNVEKTFTGIEDFVDWYDPLKGNFNESQQLALETLVGAKNGIVNGGCGCKQKQRAEMAYSYYSTFWTENAKTDLPQRVLEVANVKSINFRSGRTQELVLQVTRP